ncbi:MAG: segregation/condensation protein A, partial [Cyanobacteriota bacterium]|nr:segregation/condensation protein A [Cyanobacteriota bacterium]
LIEQIQEMAAVLESAPARPQKPHARPLARKEAARSIAQLAHDENLTEVAAQLEHFLALHLPQLLSPERSDPPEEPAFVELEQLLDWWHRANASSEPRRRAPESNRAKDRVGVFWALLLLSAQSKVELVQEEFYQDLKIRSLEGPPLVE